MNHLWARLIVEELVRCEVTHYFVAPGSRSTPLTTAAGLHPRTGTTVHFDERGTAFAALGYARATGRPAAWITTSGTALANGFPAVVEAAMDSVPMILITADRPPELRDTGANQTIDQVKLFGDYVRWHVDLPVPTADIAPEFVLSTVDQAVYRARAAPAGAVHLNAMFREPLAPEGDGSVSKAYLSPVEAWLGGSSPLTRYEAPPALPPEASLADVWDLLRDGRRVLVVAGRMASTAEAQSVLALGQQMDWPVLPDAASNLRLARPDPGDARILFFDHLLASPSLVDALAPDIVLHFGAVPTSKRLLQALKRWQRAHYVHVHPDPSRLDPNHQVTRRVQGSIEAICSHWRGLDAATSSPEYSRAWHRMDDVAARRLDTFFQETETLSEPLVARTLSRLLPGGHTLVVGSSMPVRDIDMYALGDTTLVPVAGNRGASGIDGLVATAAGTAIGSGRGVTVLTGDLGLLHDLNSLAMLRELPIVVVVLNNDGGGIFSFLPIAEHESVFEPYFGTPHGFSFESAAALFGLEYFRAETPPAFEEAYRNSRSIDKGHIIEVKTNRRENRSLHEQLLALVREAAEQEAAGGHVSGTQPRAAEAENR